MNSPAVVGRLERGVRPAVPKRCEPCRATGAVHCADPENCGGPWDKCHDAKQTLFKVDTTDCEVRCVTGGPWPAKDSEGDICFDNTHFSTHREALEKLRAECDAWLSLNFRERGRLHERLAELEKEDRRARDGMRRALAGLGLRA
jgi:hypothetical protein